MDGSDRVWVVLVLVDFCLTLVVGLLLPERPLFLFSGYSSDLTIIFFNLSNFLFRFCFTKINNKMENITDNFFFLKKKWELNN